MKNPDFCKKHRYSYLLLFTIAIVSTFFSCQHKGIILSHKFENNVWNAFSDVNLKTIIDNSKPYEVKVIISLSQDFESSNFRFGFIQKSEDGETIYSNYQIPIKNSQGDFMGEQHNDLYKYTIIIRKKTLFNSQGKYTFVFENTMNKLNIRGVHKLELILTQI